MVDAPTPQVVSSDSEELILVDDRGREIGYETKRICHDGDGILHRAFSVFVFNSSGQVLLQQRHRSKRLWPEIWANSCCSHPRRGEELQDAAHRRLQQELGLDCELEHVFTFSYHARYGDQGSEREMCAVYVGSTDQEPAVHPTEIAAWRYINPDRLDHELAQTPTKFTPWLAMEWERLRTEFPAALPPGPHSE